ncbi:MAG: hypothetical protein NVS9B12_07500 [Vulcanimicrobiaceae bacterium]
MRAFAVTLFTLGLSFVPLSAPAQSATPAPAASAAPAAAPSASTAPVAPPSAATNELAEKLVPAFLDGKLDRKLFSDTFNKSVTDDQLAQGAKQLAVLGKPLEIHYAGPVPTADYTVYVYTVKFKTLTMIESLGLDKNGKIDTWALAPKQ